jgi:hypothetical protein
MPILRNIQAIVVLENLVLGTLEFEISSVI